jgi:hypothetical protein
MISGNVLFMSKMLPIANELVIFGFIFRLYQVETLLV